MARSQVQGQTKQSQSQVSMTRTSKTGWVQDSFHPAIGKMSERIKKITGLLTNTYYDEAELLQVWKILKSFDWVFQKLTLRPKKKKKKKKKSVFGTVEAILTGECLTNSKIPEFSKHFSSFFSLSWSLLM